MRTLKNGVPRMLISMTEQSWSDVHDLAKINKLSQSDCVRRALHAAREGHTVNLDDRGEYIIGGLMKLHGVNSLSALVNILLDRAYQSDIIERLTTQ